MTQYLSAAVPVLLDAATASTDQLDTLLYATGILFILSVITEKLTQLVRMYPTTFKRIALIFFCLFYAVIASSYKVDVINKWEFSLFMIINSAVVVLIAANFSSVKRKSSGRVNRAVRSLGVMKNISKSRGSSMLAVSADETTKEKEITLLSFLLGLAIAYIFNASFFELLSDPSKIGVASTLSPVKTVDNFWQVNPAYFKFSWKAGVGFLLTAFFLSFGSKFFHDLLDNLLQIKNLRRKLNETTPDSVQELVADDPQLIKATLASKDAFLKKLPGFKNANVGAIRDGDATKYFAYINFSNSPPEEVLLSVEKVFRDAGVPVRIFTNRVAARVKFGKINNDSDRRYVGSIACGVTDEAGDTGVLTAAHVLLSGNYLPSDINDMLLDKKVNLDYDGVKAKGVWTFGWQDNTLDIAVTSSARPIPSSGLTPYTPTVDGNDLGTELFFSGATTPFGSGFLCAIDEPYDIRFANDTIPMTGLLKITTVVSGDEQSIAGEGDSGSLLFDSSQRAFGMIIASTDDFTYAIPIETILAKINKTIL